MSPTSRAADTLPTALPSFVGRQEDTAEVRRLLGRARLLTLTGVGGVGKTRLALEVAQGARAAFPDGVWLVDLAPVRQASAVAGAVAAALRLPGDGMTPVLDHLVEYLAGRRALILLDNCEHLVDPCAHLAQVLLAAATELRVLVTSRQSLGLPGEHLFTVDPLPVPDQAVELLRERAVAVQPEFAVDATNREAVVRLCRELDGLPLAIELAAAWLRTLTVDQITDRLADRFALLSRGSRTAPPHQRTLRATLDWSYGLCTPAEQALLARLSVFAGEFTLEAAEEVCSGDGIARYEVLYLLDRLVTQSVVVVRRYRARTAYRLLETVRQYGRDRLAESGEEQRAQLQHRDYFLALAEGIAAAWCGPGQQEGLERLRNGHADFLAALDCSDAPQSRLALVAALRYHWCVGGFLGEGRQQLERALRSAPEPSPLRAQALWVAAWVAMLQGDTLAACGRLDEADRLGEEFDDVTVRGHVQGLRATLRFQQGQFDEVLPLLRTALEWHQASDDAFGFVITLYVLGVAETLAGDANADETARRAVCAAETLGDRWILAHALWVQGLQSFLRSDREASAALLRAALEAGQGFDDHTWAAQTLELLAYLAVPENEYERAANLLGSARALRQYVAISPLALAPLLTTHHARCVEHIVEALGPDAFEKALAYGGRLSTPAQAVAFALGSQTPAASPVADANPLTKRERQVSALIAKGLSNRKIAAELVVSPRTVDSHVESIRAKLHFSSRAQVAAWWAAQQAPTS
ncbi:helix-turn-helix transcriptional regulator [Streptomyces fuscichromogenes]|uniref:LuxR family transcriptional regulator n=1 Tax=Streptomyces fuscichromogenes TaxID=1324013 RepID=A0A918CSQ4_9ACTN|nr:LuxR C-terminal-related transcriptional regulator [Streptomyces fuscichromogenes]GGN19510.1 LuxR family transcriptional regulator [Streptomyces fuscichromogenes]